MSSYLVGDPTKQLAAVASIAAVTSSVGNQYYYDPVTNLIQVKLVAGQNALFVRRTAL
jgi:hypothetical protein